jgi:ATP-binding cassette, subfamily G (WHITE), member 2, SNQ2
MGLLIFSCRCHPFTEAIALTIVDLPISLITLAIFGIIVYFITDLQRTAGQFLYVDILIPIPSLLLNFFLKTLNADFPFFLLMYTTSIMMKAFFRMLAAAFKREASAQALSGVFTLGLVIYTGYTIPKPSMIGALR